MENLKRIAQTTIDHKMKFIRNYQDNLILPG